MYWISSIFWIVIFRLRTYGSALVYCTYPGGRGRESGFGIAVDADGNAYVTGQTSSADFPTANALQPALKGSANAFVAKISP